MRRGKSGEGRKSDDEREKKAERENGKGRERRENAWGKRV